MNPSNHLVIMAGGIGSRFWPMSTPQCPKQFIDVLGCGRTLIQLTADRFRDICLPENTWVVTSAAYADLVRRQLPDLPPGHILLEPCRRNTAPCIAYASWRIKALNPKANIVVTPSDHVVMNTDEFRRVLRSGLAFTAENDAILTIGIKPSRPETGFGYIQADLSEPSARNREIFRVDSFREKPDLPTAERYIRQSNYLWNSGMFLFRVNTVVNAMRIYQPEISEVFESLMPVYGTPDERDAIDTLFPSCPNISIDYAVMEKADEIFVFPAEFGWSDLGTWASLREQGTPDANGNVCIGQGIQVYESTNCIVHTLGQRRVIVQGLDGYIVAQQNDSLLVCKLSEQQRITKG